MTRPTARLTAIAIKAAAPGRLLDGGGLMLDRAETGGKWTYRYTIAGQRRAVMIRWADYITAAPSAVVAIRA